MRCRIKAWASETASRISHLSCLKLVVRRSTSFSNNVDSTKLTQVPAMYATISEVTTELLVASQMDHASELIKR